MRFVLGFLSGVVGGCAGYFALVNLTLALSGRDLDGGVAMSAILEIGPVGALAGFAAGVFLFSRLGVVRVAAPSTATDPSLSETGREPPQNGIFRVVAALALVLAGIATGPIFGIGPVGALAGFVAGALLLLMPRLTREGLSQSGSGPSTRQPNDHQEPPQTRISVSFAVIVIMLAAGLSWWGWSEWVR